jgi:hypothetical protein
VTYRISLFYDSATLTADPIEPRPASASRLPTRCNHYVIVSETLYCSSSSSNCNCSSTPYEGRKALNSLVLLRRLLLLLLLSSSNRLGEPYRSSCIALQLDELWLLRFELPDVLTNGRYTLAAAYCSVLPFISRRLPTGLRRRDHPRDKKKERLQNSSCSVHSCVLKYLGFNRQINVRRALARNGMCVDCV